MGCQDAVLADVVGQFGELRFVELSARIRFRFLNVSQGMSCIADTW
jgi:hypothetical protein